jgi:DNA-binding transcriptional regulator YiaG
MKKKRMAVGLITGLKEAVAIEKGRIRGRERERVLSRPAPRWTRQQIQKLRVEVFQMSQPEFASLMNVKPATVRSWEQGQRVPDGAAARLLEIFANDVQWVDRLAS